MQKLGKIRSKTGCRSCRIRKVKCDEEKLHSDGRAEPQCKRCVTAGILCEWKGGPIPRRPTRPLPFEKKEADGKGGSDSILSTNTVRERQIGPSRPCLLLPAQNPGVADHGCSIQAANSLHLSVFDRRCLEYLQDSYLVVVLGKHWPWSTVSYAYQKIAVKEPMVMSMMLATAASEIYRAGSHGGHASCGKHSEARSDMGGQVHYGRALSELREALKQDVKSMARVEAVFITLWLMIDYEGRFGSGATAIKIHIRGIESLLHNHVVPLLKSQTSSMPEITFESRDSEVPPQAHILTSHLNDLETTSPSLQSGRLDGFYYTSVPLFLLWTLYFFTPAALFFGSDSARLDTDIFRFLLRADPENRLPLSLAELYRLSRQSPARFWGEEYPLSARLDDQENLPSLTLYHHSHVVQFKITELFKHGTVPDVPPGEESPYQRIIGEINTLSVEYDTVLTTAETSRSCETIGEGRRVMETIYWSSITYYSTIVYFYLCFQDLLDSQSGSNSAPFNGSNKLIPLNAAVSQVLELSLKLHQSRPHLMVRITWSLFIAGVATSDKIYRDWVSIRLRELSRYGKNFSLVTDRFDEIIQGSELYLCRRSDRQVLASPGKDTPVPGQ